MTTSSITVVALVALAAAVARGGAPTITRRLHGRPGSAARRVRDALRSRVLGVVRREARARGDSLALGSLVENWAAGLRAGAPAGAALASVCADLPEVRAVVPAAGVAARSGEDLPNALRSDARALADPALRRALVQAAACAAIAAGSGGRLADALDRIGAGVRADREHRDLVRAQLAAPRATARLLAVLPVAALLMETSAGMRPFEALRTGAGPWVLLGGVALALGGLAWTARIARSATRTS